LVEPEGLADLVRGGLSPRLWTDAYLAAFALAGGHRLVTFDQGFLRFPGLEVLRLFP
jgi:predicted nucleic acid-binding protein